MIVQFVQFETSLSEEEVMAVAEARAPDYAAAPGLVQKFYLKLGKPNHYGGFMIWKSREALQAFRESELAKTIPASYKVIGAPDVDIHELLFPLHEGVVYNAQLETA
jgi:heme-degrading monooxygenase HmoA